jgi:hypothetical protein
MKRREYHEIYGFLPEDIINKISEVDRHRLFIEYVLRKPTSTGWFITRTIVAALGDRFINYMLGNIVMSLEDEGIQITKDVLVDELQALMESFATDSNTLEEYVRNYRETVLGIKDDDSSDDDQELPRAKEILDDKKPNNLPERDARGRFIKSK